MKGDGGTLAFPCCLSSSESQADTQTPVLCSQSLQGLHPSRGHLGRSWGTGVGKESTRISGVGPLPQDGLCSWKQMARSKPSLLKACFKDLQTTLWGPQVLPATPCPISSCLSRVEGPLHGKGGEYHPNLTSAPDLEKGYCWNPNAQITGEHQVSRPPRKRLD